MAPGLKEQNVQKGNDRERKLSPLMRPIKHSTDGSGGGETRVKLVMSN